LQHQHITTTDNTEIHYCYQTQNSQAKLIVFVHGYAEHSKSYDDIMSWFFDRGYHVASFDVRGHGTSTGPRGYVDNYTTYDNDLHLILQLLQKACNPTTINIVAHSNGALITTHYLLCYQHPIPISRVVLSAPYLSLHDSLKIPSWLHNTLKFINRFYEHLRVSKKTNGLKLTHDKIIQDKIKNDKLRLSTASVKWYLASLDAQQEVLNQANKKLTPPLLMLLAADDRLANNKINEIFFEKLLNKDKKYICYENMYHELLNETIAKEIFNTIYAWL